MHYLRVRRAGRREKEKGRWFVANVEGKVTCKPIARAEQSWVKLKERVKAMGLERERARGKVKDQKVGVLNVGDNITKAIVREQGPLMK